MDLLIIFLTLLLFFSLIAKRLERTILTGPIFFTLAGMLAFLLIPQLLNRIGEMEVFRRLAEIGLVLLLFCDASRTDLRFLNDIRNLPGRLLSVGMLLTIVLGTLAALIVFPQLTLWEAGILAAILAPTDAGLGQVIVTSPRVPLKIRQALNVEAGLNDGLSVPFLLFFIALAGTEGAGTHTNLARYAGEQLGYGIIIGAAIGLAGGFLLRWAHDHDWASIGSEQLGIVALPLLGMLISELLGASMFITAFVAGLALRIRFKEAEKHSLEFGEEWGQLLNFSVFFLFGLIVVRYWHDWNISLIVYAVLSLTVIRILPVAIALIGTRLHWSTVLFMGWFGPRGLASIVLGLVYLEKEAQHPGETIIRLAIIATVFLSIFAHGLSAQPGIKLYTAKINTLGKDAPENQSPGPGAGSKDFGPLPTPA